MSTKFDARQIISRDVLQQIASAAGLELDDLLRSIDQDLIAPLRMSAQSPATRVISIGSGTVVNTLTNRTKSIPPIGGLLPSFTSGTITFPSASGGTITVSPGNNATLTLANNQYQKFLVYLDAAGALNVLAGTAGASEAAATVPPAPEDTLAVGYVTVFNNAGTIDNIVQGKIYQFGVGSGGGGGSGDVTSIETVLRARLLDSDMELVTPNIAKTNKATLLDNSSTATYSLISKTFEYSGAGQQITSVQMLDPDEFLDEGKDVSVVELLAFWASGYVDTAATYQISRNGGLDYQTITMERVGDATTTYRGRLTFADSETASILSTYAVGNADNSSALTGTTQQRLGQKFTLASAGTVKNVKLYLNKLGSPVGFLYASIVKDSSGVPSTALADLMAESDAVDISTLSAGNIEVTFPIAKTLPAGTYHIVLRASGYTYSAGVNQITWRTDASSPPANQQSTYNGSTWAGPTGLAHVYELNGRTLDLRVKITSSAGSKRLDGYGVFYNQSVTGIVTGQKIREVIKFNNVDGAVSGGVSVISEVTDLSALNSFTDNSTISLASDSWAKHAQRFTASASGAPNKATLQLQRIGTLAGNIYLEIRTDNAGTPSSTILATSDLIPANDVNGAAVEEYEFTFSSPANLVAGTTYHLVLRGDASYLAVADESSLNQFIAVTINFLTSYNDQGFRGGDASENTWFAILNDFKLIYKLEVGASSNEFTLTRFMPDPETLSVYCVETGQVFKFGAFTLDGNKVIFPEDTFDNGGIETEYTLIFDQTQGASFDNSDQNAALMAANHLGSTDSNIDRSSNGRGIFLRRPDGTLREITIDDNDNIVIYSV